MVAAQRIAKIPGHMRALEDQALAEVASGRITPLVNEPFPLAEAAQAHTALENRPPWARLCSSHEVARTTRVR
jgi:NADPH:quinone reductase-like Zn-dependent oxidoreductase